MTFLQAMAAFRQKLNPSLPGCRRRPTSCRRRHNTPARSGAKRRRIENASRNRVTRRGEEKEKRELSVERRRRIAFTSFTIIELHIFDHRQSRGRQEERQGAAGRAFSASAQRCGGRRREREGLIYTTIRASPPPPDRLYCYIRL